MSQPFLIIGLPRSRTAWLSVAATTQKSICHHEPAAKMQNFEDLRLLWQDDRAEYIGIADSGLVWQLGRILEELKPRTLIVERAASASAYSLTQYFAPAFAEYDFTPLCDSGAEELAQYYKHPLVSTLHYSALNHYPSVHGALKRLMPNAAFPMLHDLMHMNIQVQRDYALEAAHRPHSNWHRDTSWKDAAP